MERIVDIAVVYACCVLAMLLASWYPDAARVVFASCGGPTGMASVACFLASVISVLGCEWSRARYRAVLPAAYCMLAVAVPAGACYAPAALYELLLFVRDPLPLRAAPIAGVLPVAAMVVRGDGALAVLPVAALAAISSMLSLRTSALLAQRDLTKRTRDDLVERELAIRDLAAVEREQLVEEAPSAGVDARPRGFECLTEREYEIVRLVAEGLDNQEIASEAFISEGTVRNRISSVLGKTGCKNRTQLAVAWWRSRCS